MSSFMFRYFKRLLRVHTRTHTHTRTHECYLPFLLATGHVTGIFLEMCIDVNTHHWMSSVAQLAGRRVLTTQPCPPHPCPLKTQAATLAMSEIDMWLQVSPDHVCVCMCARVCAWASAGLVIFHWSPLSLVDKHEPLLKQTVVGG